MFEVIFSVVLEIAFVAVANRLFRRYSSKASKERPQYVFVESELILKDFESASDALCEFIFCNMEFGGIRHMNTNRLLLRTILTDVSSLQLLYPSAPHCSYEIRGNHLSKIFNSFLWISRNLQRKKILSIFLHYLPLRFHCKLFFEYSFLPYLKIHV